MIKHLMSLHSSKWKRATAIKEQLEKLSDELHNLLEEASPAPLRKVMQKKRKMNAAARKKISEAAKARWAKVRSAKQ